MTKGNKKKQKKAKATIPEKEKALNNYIDFLEKFEPHTKKEGKIFKKITNEFPELENLLLFFRVLKTHCVIEKHKDAEKLKQLSALNKTAVSVVQPHPEKHNFSPSPAFRKALTEAIKKQPE